MSLSQNHQLRRSSALDRTYRISLVIKAVDGVLELIGAGLLAFIQLAVINRLVIFLTQRELSHDPRDIVAVYIQQAGQHLVTGGRTYGVLYLLGHGLIKLVVVGALLKGYRWAYGFSLITLGLFVVYQTYQIILHASLGLIALTGFDIFIMWLVWREARQHHVRLIHREVKG